MPSDKLGFDPPDGLTTDDFILRPIVAADAELGYAAVMETRERLREWEQSSPEDDFTLEANRADLVKLETWHTNRGRFAYTMMNPSGTEVLGCVYILPNGARMFT